MDLKEIAKEMIEEDGLINLSRAGLCKRAGIPNGSFALVAGTTFTEFIKEFEDPNFTGDVTRLRTNPELRKEFILRAAVLFTQTHGLRKLTRTAVAEAAGVSDSLVSMYFPMSELKDRVMEYAVREGIRSIVAEGLLIGSAIALAAPPELKQAAADYIARR